MDIHTIQLAEIIFSGEMVRHTFRIRESGNYEIHAYCTDEIGEQSNIKSDNADCTKVKISQNSLFFSLLQKYTQLFLKLK